MKEGAESYYTLLGNNWVTSEYFCVVWELRIKAEDQKCLKRI